MRVDQRIEDGWIVLGDTAGLGIVFDEQQLDELAVAPQVAPPSPASGSSPWGRRRGAGLYEVGPEEAEEPFDE
jgi:hypothetical protein